MRGKLWLLVLLVPCTVSAQLTISPGALFSIKGISQLTLRNSDITNNGTFTSGQSMVSFTGDLNTAVSGSQPIQFSQIEINKTSNGQVSLQRGIAVSDRVLFSAGFLNLNGFNTDLGNTGHLEGEQETARAVGAAGGEIIFDTTLNFPVNVNPANLGLLISASQNLGNVIIRRGHQSISTNPITNMSILRYYDIEPTNNINLNATVRLIYFDGELNGLDKNSLVLFTSVDSLSWAEVGFTSRDTSTNFVEQTGVGAISLFTLARAGNSPLPVRFISFATKCEDKKVVVSWETAQEQRSSRFDIQKSLDGIHWTVIGNRAAAGNSIIEQAYSFDDNNPIQNSFYRIAEYDLDGKIQYTGISRSSCDIPDQMSFWPNPFHENVFINIVSNNESTASISVFDNKGALVKMQKAVLLRGTNQVRVDMGTMANGVYSMYIEWNNGQMKKAVQVLKQ